MFRQASDDKKQSDYCARPEVFFMLDRIVALTQVSSGRVDLGMSADSRARES
jgi:hypothetical protein